MEININLIPQYKKDQIAHAKHLNLIVRTEVGVAMLLAFLLVFVWGLNKILDFNLNAVIASQNTESGQDRFIEIAKYQENFKTINNDISLVSKVKKDQLYWSSLFIKLSSYLTAGITITDLANNNYSISIAGTADTRDNLIAFKDKLAGETCFSDVNLPLSNLVDQENVAFQMDFKIKENCVKKQK